jgi:proteasome lid subunit RPN8/RPN11
MLDCALAAPGEEVCGLVGGRAGAPVRFYPVDNRAADRTTRFLMDPEQQIEAMRGMREAGLDLVGIFHSHPDTAAEPSSVDLEMAAYPGVIYFIASMQDPVPQLRAYLYDGSGFQELSLPETSNDLEKT